MNSYQKNYYELTPEYLRDFDEDWITETLSEFEMVWFFDHEIKWEKVDVIY